jgi:hypothetical protein
MGRNDKRINGLEKDVSPGGENIIVMYVRWNDEELPPEQIDVMVSHPGDFHRKPEKMTMADYRKRYPGWENDTMITLEWDDIDFQPEGVM